MDKERKRLEKAIIEYGIAKVAMEEAFKLFGKQFRKRRELEGLSLREAAELLHISPMFLSDIELGRRRANKEVIHLFKGQKPS